jgi:hypothetical protein
MGTNGVIYNLPNVIKNINYSEVRGESSIQDGDKESRSVRTNFEPNITYKILRGDLDKNENIILNWMIK